MVCILYKEGNTHTNRGVKCEAGRFPVNRVKALLEAGWVTDPRTLYGENDVSEEKEPEAEIKTTVQNTDEASKAKSPKEIRAAAKEAGILGYAKLRITTLREKLGYEHS